MFRSKNDLFSDEWMPDREAFLVDSMFYFDRRRPQKYNTHIDIVRIARGAASIPGRDQLMKRPLEQAEQPEEVTAAAAAAPIQTLEEWVADSHMFSQSSTP